MASGEMSATQFESFLRTALGNSAAHSVDGSIHYVCMAWSKMRELLAATETIYSELKNLCVWCKPNGGMGSCTGRSTSSCSCSSRAAPHINNIELGRLGRNRTNVWDYPGQNVLNGTSKSKLALHPTVKPVGLVADAIRDCSHRNGIILDPFGGAGSTVIAAERTGRKALLDRDGSPLRRRHDQTLADTDGQNRCQCADRDRPPGLSRPRRRRPLPLAAGRDR